MTNQELREALINTHHRNYHSKHLALGSLRYETLRKLTPRQYTELHKRNIAGENFDGMVDALMLPNDKLCGLRGDEKGTQ